MRKVFQKIPTQYAGLFPYKNLTTSHCSRDGLAILDGALPFKRLPSETCLRLSSFHKGKALTQHGSTFSMIISHHLDLEQSISRKYNALSPHMDERTRRIWAATEARELGYGGEAIVHRATGLDLKTISRGNSDLKEEALSPPQGKESLRIRKKGGGRKHLRLQNPSFVSTLDAIIDPTVRGDPMSGIRWTCKSTRKLAKELCQNKNKVSHMTVKRELKRQKYSLQGNRKTDEGSSHPDRDAQFHHINDTVTAFQQRGEPVISVDTKKKELVGNYKNCGKEWLPKGKPKDVKVYDFIDKKVGKAIPYGVYDITKNKGFVSVGVDHDTAEFAVETIRRWWNGIGHQSYPTAKNLYITADGGGSNASRNRLWKKELQKLADETQLSITVSHYPPGTSKWNKIEHCMFSHISMSWRAIPLVSRELIVELISHTTTETGLKIVGELNTKEYKKGLEVSKKEFDSLSLFRKDFHGEWNYTLIPRERSS